MGQKSTSGDLRNDCNTGAYRPSPPALTVTGVRWFSGHKRRHTTVTQFTVDLQGYIIHTSVSLPGSFNDRRVMISYTDYCTEPARFFQPGEYITGASIGFHIAVRR